MQVEEKVALKEQSCNCVIYRLGNDELISGEDAVHDAYNYCHRFDFTHRADGVLLYQGKPFAKVAAGDKLIERVPCPYCGAA